MRVAEKIGFKDSHYFCICFKKQTGQTVKKLNIKKNYYKILS